MKKFIFLIVMIAMLAIYSTAQTTEFTYQGQLQNSSTPATGVFDFEFALFDANSGGGQIGSTNTRTGISVASGIFSVNLDFGQSFPGGSRFLEIRVRQSGGGAFTTLSPRQPVASAPYSIKSLNADTAQTAATATNAVNSTNAVNATNATTATSFTGPLTGDVTGTQASTTVARLRGTNVASAAPTDGQVLKYNAATAQWRPDTDNTGAGGGGTITGVTAGTGLAGGGTTGSVTLGIANGGVSTGQLADGSVTDAKIVSVSGAKVTGTVANANNAATANSVAISCVGCVSAAQIGSVNGSAVTGAIPVASVPAGSGNYIQNSTVAQATSNFNISGNGFIGGELRANEVASTTGFYQNQFGSSNPSLVFHNPGNSLYVGGSQGRTGAFTVHLGHRAGAVNTGGSFNAFLGAQAGQSNTSGENNVFVGYSAGSQNMIGTNNTIVGFSAGNSTLNGGNTFLGSDAGDANTIGSNNTIIGRNADVSANNLIFATALGASAIATESNSVTLGRSSDIVRVPGYLLVLNGTDAEPGSGGYVIIGPTSSTNVAIDNNEIMARNAGAVATLAINADGGNVHLIQGGTGSVGIGTSSPDQKLSVNGNASKTGGTSWAVFSDERLKDVKGHFSLGLDTLRRLQPIRFEYRKDNPLGLVGVGEQIGFSAQEVQKVLPEAVTTSRDGFLQLNVDPILWTMLNSINEQDAEMEKLRNQIREQNAVVVALKKAHCDQNPLAEICKK